MGRSDWFRVVLVTVASCVAACHFFVTVKVDGVGRVDPCGPVVPPAGIGGAGDGGAERPILFALYRLPPALTDDPELCADPAFDLDGQDTQASDGGCLNLACEAQGSALVVANHCDFPGGRDDSLRQSLENTPVTEFTGYDTDSYLKRGLTNLLIRVSGYDGSENDDAVEVAFYGSAGIEGAVPGSASPFDAEPFPVVWDGGQDFAWTVDEVSVVPDSGASSLPVARIAVSGYVRDSVIIVPDVGAGLVPIAPIRIRFTGGTFMGRLDRDGSRFKLTKGRLGLRLLPSDVLTRLVAPSVSKGRELCDPVNAQSYPVGRAGVCGNVNLPAGPVAPGAKAKCEELSMGLGLAGIESRFATVDAGEGLERVLVQPTAFELRPPCEDAGTMFCDDCANPGPGRCPVPDGG